MRSVKLPTLQRADTSRRSPRGEAYETPAGIGSLIYHLQVEVDPRKIFLEPEEVGRDANEVERVAVVSRL